MNEKMTYDAVIKHFGSQAKLAKALGIKRQAVNKWGGKIPPLRQYQIVDIANGKFALPRRVS